MTDHATTARRVIEALDEYDTYRGEGGNYALQQFCNSLEVDFRGDSWSDAIRAMCERAQVAEERFPCGHRVVDWDDSYGGCVACITRTAMLELEEELTRRYT